MGCKPPEQTVPSAFAHNRAFLVKTFSKDLNRTLSSFGIEGLNADERIRTADSRIYEGCLNIGMSGFDENVVALAISSIGCCFQGMPIKVLLI